jgi:hypothetical protein
MEECKKKSVLSQEERKKKSVLSQDIIGSTTFPVTSPAEKTAGAGARRRKKDGPAEAAARIKKRKKKEKQKRQHDIDLLVTIMPTAVNATNIMRLLSPRFAPRYTFDPVLVDPKDKDKVNEITGAAHQLF